MPVFQKNTKKGILSGSLSAETLVEIFNEVQYEDESGLITYAEFIHAMTIVANFHNPRLNLPIAVRVELLLENTVLAKLAYKFKPKKSISA